jgi:hypothetical protein
MESVDRNGVLSTEFGRLLVQGLKTCGSVHSCPMCAASILAERAAEITTLLRTVPRDRVAFVTFTLRHNRNMALAPLRKLQALAYSELKAGRPGADFRDALGHVGDVKSAEQTWGEANGWHPHFHAAWVFNKTPTEELNSVISNRWHVVVINAHHRLMQALDYFIHGQGPRAARERKSCTCAKCSPTGDKSATCDVYSCGGLGTDEQRSYAMRMFGSRYVRKNVPLSEAALWFKRELETLGKPKDFLPDLEHGVWIEPVRDSASDADRVARYLAKLGLELAGIATKTGKNGHFTSWDIAREAATGDARFAELWKEHGRCMLGARQLTWSRGLRAYAGLLPERTDEEIATDPLAPCEVERLLGVIVTSGVTGAQFHRDHR